MSLTSWKSKFAVSSQTRSGKFVAPSFVLDLEPGFVAAARLSPSKRQVLSVGVRGLPTGSLVASPNKSNFAQSDTIHKAIAEVIEKVGNTGGRLGLLIPDVSVRVALLQFETLPDNPAEAEALVRWKMREYLPYAPEEARLTFQVVGRTADQIEVLGVAVRSSVMAEFESALTGFNRGGPALVLPATVALLPLLPEDEGGQLLLHLCPGALTAVVVASNRVRYWRTRVLAEDGVGNADEVGREAARVLATCQDNLSVKVENVWYCGRPPADMEVDAALAQALGRQLLPLKANCFPAGGLPSGQNWAFEQFGMPFAGLVANLS